jgi:hypothetical protein
MCYFTMFLLLNCLLYIMYVEQETQHQSMFSSIFKLFPKLVRNLTLCKENHCKSGRGGLYIELFFFLKE